MEREALQRDRARPLTVLLLSRTERRSGGGIARSAELIRAALTEVGDVVRLRSVNELLTDIPSDTDVVWHYGDIDHIAQQVGAADSAGVPIIINSTFDDTADRRRWMIGTMKSWQEWVPGHRVYFAVFTEAARNDPRLHAIHDRLVTLPKTVRLGGEAGWRGFGERQGICVGEVEKLKRARLVRDIDVQVAINMLREAFPEQPIYAFDQYATAGTVPPEGVTIVSPGGEMMQFLGGLKLYISLSRHETFSMVPAEAQGVGTPVLYRPMPQSLSEHFGWTAYPFDTVEEMMVGAYKLLLDEKAWIMFSAAGGLNAEARSVNCVGTALDLALRKVVFR